MLKSLLRRVPRKRKKNGHLLLDGGVCSSSRNHCSYLEHVTHESFHSQARPFHETTRLKIDEISFFLLVLCPNFPLYGLKNNEEPNKCRNVDHTLNTTSTTHTHKYYYAIAALLLSCFFSGCPQLITPAKNHIPSKKITSCTLKNRKPSLHVAHGNEIVRKCKQ